MSWEQRFGALFDELEQQAVAAFEEDRVAEVADRSRAEYAEVTLASRLVASVGREVRVSVSGVGVVSGTLERAGATWCLVTGRGHSWLIVAAALESATGVSARSVPEAAWRIPARLSLASGLRGLADAAEPCVLRLRDGHRLEGVLLRVGRDFVEVRSVSGEPTLVALAALAAVQSRADT